MVTVQSAVTVVADIVDGHAAELHRILESAGGDAGNNELLPFGRLSTVHFARFFIWDAVIGPQGERYPAIVVFLADVDGPPELFLQALIDLAPEGLDQIFSHCRAYPGASHLLQFLQAHSLPVAAKYVNTIGRTVEQIRQEATLHTAIEDFLDRTQTQWRGADPRRVRAAIQEFVEKEPSLAWARRPLPKPEPFYVLGEKLHFLLVTVAGIVFFPAILLALPPYLAVLRWHEKRDQGHDVLPDDGRIQGLQAQEDHGIQNPFTSAGFVKPNAFRRFTGTVVLWGADFLTRHIFNHANLIGVKTIHFARWVFLDRKRRLVFATSYDGSLENYMDDFVDKIAWSLNIVFSNGVDYPRTNWLILDGAHDEQVFKRFNINHQLVTPFWYAGYQGLTALNIDNNAEIRAGLYGAMDTASARAWLRRL